MINQMISATIPVIAYVDSLLISLYFLILLCFKKRAIKCDIISHINNIGIKNIIDIIVLQPACPSARHEKGRSNESMKVNFFKLELFSI